MLSMSEIKKKTPRKISCLPCRTKKAKCDGGIPHCDRCIRNHRENKCIYPKPRTFGRPPKKAIFHKNQPNTSAINSENQIIPPAVSCREFIFENTFDVGPSTLSVHLQQQLILANSKQPKSKKLAQILDIERIFALYISKGEALKKKLNNVEFVPPFKMKTLHQRFTWLSSILVHMTIRRSCQLIDLESFYDPEITLIAFIKKEDINVYFYMANEAKKGIQHVNNLLNPSPLDSIPTDQAIQLIDRFFQFHSYSLLLNKTKVLNDYWNDKIEPLLLCVIYGTTIYTCQQALKSKYFILWDVNRNPFLNHAYTLLERYFLNRDKFDSSGSTTLGYYQATVILGIFETLFGLAKHGMTTISLSYMMGSDLGIFHNENDILYNEKIATLDPIDRELLVNTYWASLRCTSYGCIELGLYIRDSLLFHGQPFPPANINTSASYQYDLLYNNHTPSSSYLIESFHTEMVITYFTSKLFACLPKTEYNVFDCPTTPISPPTIEELLQQYQALVQLLDASCSENKTIGDFQIERVLNDFKLFIEQEGSKWSSFQSYMIETTYFLYSIHFKFPKSHNHVSPIRYHKIESDLDLSDIKISNQIKKLLPITNLLIQKIQQFSFEKHEFDDENDINLSLLPLKLMVAGLETAIQLTMYQYLLDNQNKHIQNQFKSLYFILKRTIWTHCGSVTKKVQKKFKDFIKLHQISITLNQQQPEECNLKEKNHNIVSLVLPSNTTVTTGAGELPILFMEESTSTTNNSPQSNYFDDYTFLKEFDDIFQQAIDMS